VLEQRAFGLEPENLFINYGDAGILGSVLRFW